ncbi:dihydroneopterin aldolase [Thiomicrorhabdus sediminis]|uniref:7,8-dihydroneopterin aldolase n=1 Tax=Thiomicrorhabdus sediminis TaxID=2580412 RepID=A0A4P9K8M9_9GAMM|nr:dihydroneopterin aldolase [Thiomicrorhabdus sediminis]QCU90820.1 dihydroneopterin aldolase [Thiomicrorhabdus sediminis]
MNLTSLLYSQLDTIYIEALKTQAIIGIYDWERANRQPLIFDIEMDLPLKSAAMTDDITQTVDYKTVCDQVIEFVENSEFELLETLVEQICEQIFSKHPTVMVIRLKVSKPMAVEQTDTVGLKVTRCR